MIPIEILFEGLIFSSDDLVYKFDNWKSGKIKVLLITGFTGSGKTTLGEKLAEIHNARFTSLDARMSDKGEHQQMNGLSNESLVNYLDNIKTPTVYEATQIVRLLTPKEASKYSVIIRGTGYFKSSYRGASRDSDGKIWLKGGDAIRHHLSINKHYLPKLKAYYDFFSTKKQK